MASVLAKRLFVAELERIFVASLRENLEWIGGVAIVVSLLLVAYEIRQNTNAIAAQAVFDLNASGNGLLMVTAIDPEMSRLVGLGSANLDALNSDERSRYRDYVWANLNMYESAWIHYQRGIVNDEEIESWRIDFCDYIAMNGVRQLLQDIPAMTSSTRRTSAEWCSKEE